MASRNSRLRSRKPAVPAQVGVAWYDAVQWVKLKQIAADPEKMDDTHEAWQRNAENTERELTARGLTLRRVPIDVDALVRWCRAQNKPVDGAARSEYTTLIVNGKISS